jgi:type III secretion system FlhB-like substrate exporter
VAERDRAQALGHPADQALADGEAEVADHLARQSDVALHDEHVLVADVAHVDADHVGGEQARHLLARGREHVAQRRVERARLERGVKTGERRGWRVHVERDAPPTGRNLHGRKAWQVWISAAFPARIR